MDDGGLACMAHSEGEWGTAAARNMPHSSVSTLLPSGSCPSSGASSACASGVTAPTRHFSFSAPALPQAQSKIMTDALSSAISQHFVLKLCGVLTCTAHFIQEPAWGAVLRLLFPLQRASLSLLRQRDCNMRLRTVNLMRCSFNAQPEGAKADDVPRACC